MEDYEDIFRFCESNVYPSGLSKEGKRNYRRKCQENFKVENGQLFHRKSDRGKQPHAQSADSVQNECGWKLCVKTEDEKERVLKSCHSSATG